MVIRGVPNARVEKEVGVEQWLEQAGDEDCVSEVKARLAGMRNGGKGVDPEEVRAIGREFGYEVRVSWPSNGAAGSYEVEVRKCGRQGAEEEIAEGEMGKGMALSEQGPRWSGYANRPSADWGDGGIAGEMREYLKERLPGYMLPMAYIEIEKMPMTPNGKVDRKALLAFETDTYEVCGYESPMGETETVLAEIWAEVLKAERVGRHDNFFELGGTFTLSNESRESYSDDAGN